MYYRLQSGHWPGGVCSSLQQLQENSILCDTVLYTNEGDIPAHACVLAAASPYLREMIVSQTSESNQLDKLHPDALRALVGYMYSGEVCLTFCNVLYFVTINISHKHRKGLKYRFCVQT